MTESNNRPNFQETCFTERPPPTSEKWHRLELNNENDYATGSDSEQNPFEMFKLCLLTFDTKVYSTSIFNLTVLKFYSRLEPDYLILTEWVGHYRFNEADK